MESEQYKIQQELLNPAVYNHDNRAQILKLQERLNKIELDLEVKFKRWEEVERKNEENTSHSVD